MNIYTVFCIDDESIAGADTDEDEAYQLAVNGIRDIIEGRDEEFYRHMISVDRTSLPCRVSYESEDGETRVYMIMEATLLYGVKG